MDANLAGCQGNGYILVAVARGTSLFIPDACLSTRWQLCVKLQPSLLKGEGGGRKGLYIPCAQGGMRGLEFNDAPITGRLHSCNIIPISLAP